METIHHMLPLVARSRLARTVLAVMLLAGADAAAWDADLDPTFSDDGVLVFSWDGYQPVNGIAVQPDGKIVAVGRSGNVFASEFGIARFNPDGELDPTFGVDGVLVLDIGSGDSWATDVAIQPDGKIVIVGTMLNSIPYAVVLRFDPDGTPVDAGSVPFGVPAYGEAVAIQPDGKIVVAGRAVFTTTESDFAVARVNPDYSMDTEFGTDGMISWDFDGGFDVANDVAVRSDGKIVLAGTATRNGGTVFGVMLFSATGGPQGLGWADFGFESEGNGLALQADGKAVVAGRRLHASGGDMVVARFNTNCTLDTSFDGDGMRIFSPSATGEEGGEDVIVQHDGKIVVLGYLSMTGRAEAALVRFTSTGDVDAGFSGGPYSTFTTFPFSQGWGANGRAIAQQADGKLVVGGWSEGIAYSQHPAVARLQGNEDLIFTDGFESGTTDWW